MKKDFNHWINRIGLLITSYTSISVMVYAIERLA